MNSRDDADTEEIELCVLRPIPAPLRARHSQTLIGATTGGVWVDRFVVHRHAGRVRMHEAKVGHVTEPFDSERLLPWPHGGYLPGGMDFSVEVEALQEDADVAVSVFARRRKGSGARGYQLDPATGRYDR